MELSNDKNQNNYLKKLYVFEDDLQSNYFLEKQRKYWESLKAANDNRGNNE